MEVMITGTTTTIIIITTAICVLGVGPLSFGAATRRLSQSVGRSVGLADRSTMSMSVSVGRSGAPLVPSAPTEFQL